MASRAVREITNAAWMLPGPHSATFHGRDVFSPVAAHLARGEDWTKAGPALARLTRLTITAPVLDANGITGHVIGLDGPYGNLITDIKPEQLRTLGYVAGDIVKIRVSGRELSLPFVATFGDVPEGKPLLYIDSSGLVSVAINMGNFSQSHEVTPPAEFFIARRASRRSERPAGRASFLFMHARDFLGLECASIHSFVRHRLIWSIAQRKLAADTRALNIGEILEDQATQAFSARV